MIDKKQVILDNIKHDQKAKEDPAKKAVLTGGTRKSMTAAQ
jgi:hypothetical protein